MYGVHSDPYLSLSIPSNFIVLPSPNRILKLKGQKQLPKTYYFLLWVLSSFFILQFSSCKKQSAHVLNKETDVLIINCL